MNSAGHGGGGSSGGGAVKPMDGLMAIVTVDFSVDLGVIPGGENRVTLTVFAVVTKKPFLIIVPGSAMRNT